MGVRLFAAGFAVLCLTAVYLPAQSTDAVLSGTVTDPSGSAVPQAVVAALNVKTGVAQQTATNQAGIYLFAALQPGVYRLTAEYAGFRKYVLNEVLLEVGARISLNLALEIGAVSESVEVVATAQTTLGYNTSSVGSVIGGQRLLDLPLVSRNALALTATQAGVVGDNFNGARIGTLNISLDGINVQDNRINVGVSSPIFTSVDRIEEFRIITSPADAEFGRGSGQIQMITRSGTNQFHGSLFNLHRNTVMTANTWFNNQRGRDSLTGEPVSPRNILILNQYGGRVGGPLVRNRTFFHFLFEAERQRTRNSVTATTYTATGRQGLYRFFPGVRNANANAAVPTVDLSGNPARPAQATGDLQTASVFGRDPNRMAADRTGVVQRMLDLMPLPNNFRFGDGLNTAGYTWSRRTGGDFDKFSLRFDHVFDTTHRANFSYDWEFGRNKNTFVSQPFPGSPGGDSQSKDRLYSLTVTSTLRPTLLNEFHSGALRPRLRFFAPWELAGSGLQPQAGSFPYVLDFGSVTDPLNHENDPQGRITPVYQFSDNLTWLKGKHAVKGGVVVQFVSTNGFNSFDVLPRAVLGTGGAPLQNFASIFGIGQNQGAAEGLLNELSGSIGNVRQAFNAPAGANPAYLPGEPKQRTWKQREFSFFFKDDFKVTPNLTLNLGVRYELYGVPWEANGKAAGLASGSAGLFGVSGTSFADLYQPGRLAGSLTQVLLVGPGSPNPDLDLYQGDNNNWAPAVGLAWKLPAWGRIIGKDSTVLRMGYGIGYERNSLRLLDVVAGDLPGLREVRTFTTASFLGLTSLRLPLTPLGRPLDPVPLTDRTQIVRAYDTGLRSPYIQNWNVTLQRQLTRNTVLEIRYVGSKGTRLVRGADINEHNIFETGILDAFRITQAGGNSPLLDRMFMGLNIAGLGVVDGVRITGSEAVRFTSTTQGLLAGHGVGSLASYLATTDQYTGQRGGLVRRAGLPENFIIANPQFASSRLTSNFASSTHNAMQIELVKRFSAGWTFQGNYTWGRSLGEEEGAGQEMVDNYRDLRNRRLDKRLMGFHRTHVVRTNASWDLPFGAGKPFVRSGSGVLSRLAADWRIGAIFNLFSGAPMTVGSGVASWNAFGDNTPVAVAPFAKSTGVVRKTGQGVVYFDGLQQVVDPSVASLTTQRNIQGRSTLLAITDSSGRLLLVNPTPGVLGNLSPAFLESPGSFRLDLSLVKRIRIAEGKTLELRADAVNFSNSPQFSGPNTDINSTNFGRITGAGGNRIIVVGGRFNF